MANRMKLQLGGWEELLTKFDELGGDVQELVTEVLNDAGEDIGVRTKEAMNASNLPAGGKYSQGDTEKTIILNPETIWHGGAVAEINVGFDKTKNGAGTLLITGTPRMRPNYALEKLFVNKSYMKEINSQISETISERIVEKMEG